MNKLTFSTILLTCSTLLSTPQAFAEKMSAEDMFTQCGIGGMLFSEKPVLAAISNVTWDSGTTAVSSGLSNNGCSGSEYQAASLVYNQYASIESETATGSGQHLTALMDIYGCNAPSQQTVLSSVRNDFSNIVATPEYSSLSQVSKSKLYFNSLNINIAKSCII